MDIRTLKYFLAVIKEESITKAAQTLHMSQPPLSRHMQELEEELGKKLFIRTNKKIILTEDGQLLKKRAQELIDLFEKIQTELTSPNEEIKGTIYIGQGETSAVGFLAHIAHLLQKRHPFIRYQLYSGDASIVLDKLDKELIDFGLLISPVKLKKYDVLHLPLQDTWGVLMRKDSELASKSSISCQDLWNKPLILSHQAYKHQEIMEWFQKDSQELNVVLTYDLLFNASLFVRQGLGYAIALDQIIYTGLDSELCFRPLSPALKADLFIVWKKNRIFSKAGQAFLSLLEEQLDQKINGKI